MSELVESFDIAAGTVAGATTPVPGATITPNRTGALRITVAISSDDTLRMIRDGGTPMPFGGGVTLGVDRLSTFTVGVIKDAVYTFDFLLGGTIRDFHAEIVSGGVV